MGADNDIQIRNIMTPKLSPLAHCETWRIAKIAVLRATFELGLNATDHARKYALLNAFKSSSLAGNLKNACKWCHHDDGGVRCMSFGSEMMKSEPKPVITSLRALVYLL